MVFDCQTRSGDSGMATEPSRCLIGPAALGLMSKSKICVGSHSVAQALGTRQAADLARARDALLIELLRAKQSSGALD